MIQKYIYVTQWYDNAEVGTIWELVENPSVNPKQQARIYVVKSKTGTRWIAKDCGLVITKHQNPEYFL